MTNFDGLTDLHEICETLRTANNRLVAERRDLRRAVDLANRLNARLDSRLRASYHAYHLLAAETERCSRVERDARCWGCLQSSRMETEG